MSTFQTELSRIATINLLYAQAEIEAGGKYDAVTRALAHVQQAERCLGMLATEIRPEEEDSDETD